ncbi:MAG TPA: hypothetical protein VGI95_12340 [Caulobacteraceae bacterium]|jgi:hypothetical protein
MTEEVGNVVITCPKTGLSVETVFRLRPSALESLQGQHFFRCKRCGEIHAWGKEDAWLEHARPKRA